MRILKVTQAYEPFLERGGPAVKVAAIARALAARGHHVTVLTADLGMDRLQEQRVEGRCSRWGWEMRRDGIETIFLSARARYRTLTWNPGIFGFCRERLQEFDLAHLYGLYDLLGPVVAARCRSTGRPYVVEPMGMFRPIVRSLWLKRAYHLALGRRMLRGARRLIATSEQERRELLSGGFPEKQICTRRNGVEVPQHLPAFGAFRRKHGIAAETKVVLFLGRLVAKKSPDLLLEAFAAWREQLGNPNESVLILAGPDEADGYRQQLEALAARLGLNGVAVLVGPLYEESKWAAFRDADVFLLPSQNENFGNAAAEAIACGTPVIVTDRCGIAPLVAGRAGLVVPHDRGALQAALGQILEDSSLRDRLRKGCAEVARELTWEEPLNVLEKLYTEISSEARLE